MLLYPERGLLLNDTAIDILKCCTGQFTIETIVNILSAKYSGFRYELIANDVITFISHLQSRGLIED